MFTSDQGSQPATTGDLKATADSTLTSHLVHRHGRRDALDGMQAKVWQSNNPATSCCVASLMTTVLGWASPCRRAVMLGVSPRASCSRLSPPPISPMTTKPV